MHLTATLPLPEATLAADVAKVASEKCYSPLKTTLLGHRPTTLLVQPNRKPVLSWQLPRCDLFLKIID